MSTAKKRTIKYVAFVSVLILIVSYFSLLSPTSAYFYKTHETESKIKFEMFDVQQTVFENKDILKFKGATKLCDTGELLFDDVAIVKEITVLNNNNKERGVNARMLVNVTPEGDSVENGFRYVAFIEKITNETETVADGEETPTAVSKGEIKTNLENLFGIDENSTAEDIETKINAHNAKLRNSENAEDKFLLAPGESAKVTIIFWSEYDSVMSYINEKESSTDAGKKNWQNAGEIVNIEYPCKIEIIASQDEDAAVNSFFETTAVEETTVEETTENQ